MLLPHGFYHHCFGAEVDDDVDSGAGAAGAFFGAGAQFAGAGVDGVGGADRITLPGALPLAGLIHL